MMLCQYHMSTNNIIFVSKQLTLPLNMPVFFRTHYFHGPDILSLEKELIK